MDQLIILHHQEFFFPLENLLFFKDLKQTNISCMQDNITLPLICEFSWFYAISLCKGRKCSILILCKFDERNGWVPSFVMLLLCVNMQCVCASGCERSTAMGHLLYSKSICAIFFRLSNFERDRKQLAASHLTGYCMVLIFFFLIFPQM